MALDQRCLHQTTVWCLRDVCDIEEIRGSVVLWSSHLVWYARTCCRKSTKVSSSKRKVRRPDRVSYDVCGHSNKIFLLWKFGNFVQRMVNYVAAGRQTESNLFRARLAVVRYTFNSKMTDENLDHNGRKGQWPVDNAGCISGLHHIPSFDSSLLLQTNAKPFFPLLKLSKTKDLTEHNLATTTQKNIY